MAATEKITVTVERKRKKDFLKLISRYEYVKLSKETSRKTRRKKSLTEKEIMKEVYAVRYGIKK